MNKNSLNVISKQLSSHEVTPSDLFNQFNGEVKQKNDSIFALRELNPLWEAEVLEADKRWQAGKQKSPLDGIPIAVKDNFSTTSMKTCAGSKILENYQAPYNATVVEKLLNKGMIIAGKTNMDEFAMGSSTETSYFGKTKNPIDESRVPGGSSGGSAAVVAAEMMPVSLGSDTGGSIRQPASFCGTVGFKPSYGAVSRFGLLSMASSLDQIGTFSHSVEDTKILFDIIRGQDKFDATSKEVQPNGEVQKITIGYDPAIIANGLDEPTASAMSAVIEKLKQHDNFELREIKIEYLEVALPTYYIIMPAEVSSNLARYDGIRFGHSNQTGGSLRDVYLNSRSEGFGEEVKRRIILGTYVLSSGYYEAYYKQAQKVRRAISQSLYSNLSKVDVLLLPTSPTVAFPFGAKSNDPLQMYLSDIFTVLANLAGLPAISLPSSSTGSLPVGIQLIGQTAGDNSLLEIAEKMEKEIING